MTGNADVLIGQGYNPLAQVVLGRKPAVVVQRNTLLQGKTTDTAPGIVAEDALKGQVLLDGAPEGILTIEAFESLSELHKLASSSFTLAAKLEQLGLSLDVSASREHTVDVTNLYYLLRITSPMRTRKVAGTLDFTDSAKKFLGLASDEIQAAITAVSKKQAEVDAAKLQLDTLTQKKATAQTALKDAEITLSTAAQDLAILDQLLQQDKENATAKKQHETCQIAVATAQSKLKTAQEALQQAQQALEAQQAVLDAKKSEMEPLNVAVKNLKTNALAAINAVKLSAFYKEYGSEYVNAIIDGRELIAVITVNRSAITDKKVFDLKASLNVKQVEVGGGAHSELSQMVNEAITDIKFVFTGMQGSALSLSPKTMDDLYKLVQEFYKKDNYSDPGVIDFKTTSYRDELSALGVGMAVLDAVDNTLARNRALLAELQELRTRAVRCYAPHSYHQQAIRIGPTVNRGGNQITLANDPHVLFLQAQFDLLFSEQTRTGIIAELNGHIQTIEKDICGNHADPAAAIRPFITQVTPEIARIENNINPRAAYKLLYVNEQLFNRFSEVKIYSLPFPVQATHVMITMGAGEAQQGQATVAAADTALQWIPGVQCRLQQYHQSWFTFNTTLLRARDHHGNRHNTDEARCTTAPITPEMREESAKFAVDKFRHMPDDQVTLRLFAAVSPSTLGIGTTPTDAKDLFRQAIRASTVEPSVAQVGLFSRGNKVVQQATVASAVPRR